MLAFGGTASLWVLVTNWVLSVQEAGRVSTFMMFSCGMSWEFLCRFEMKYRVGPAAVIQSRGAFEHELQELQPGFCTRVWRSLNRSTLLNPRQR